MSNLEDYQLAALASDAYHRGYHAMMANLTEVPDDGLGSEPGTSVAGGVVIASSKDLDPARPDISADFYAVAYLIGDEVVISYRGSDNLVMVQNPDGSVDWIGADGHDVMQMWMGLVVDQVELALEFFSHVLSLLPSNIQSTSITLTGHSLGGALAATVAEIHNVDAVVFNNTSYQAVVSAIIQQVTNANPNLYAEMKERVFGAADPWTDFRQGTITQIALEGDIAGLFRQSDNVDDVDMGTPLDAKPAHYQALLTLALYAREHHGEYGDWRNAANAVFTELNDNGIAAGLGIAQANSNPPAGVMLDMIASTVLPGGSRFGSSAALSLTNDMQDLGSAAASAVNMTTMSTLIVQYAALQAKNAISEIGNDGFLFYDAGSSLLIADFSQTTWTFDQHEAVFSGEDRDFSGYLADRKLDATEITALTQGPGRIEYEYYSNAAGGWAGQIYYQGGQFYAVRAFGTGLADDITGTDGDEQILLGGGNDQVKANGGVNWIDGGDGDDKLIDDNAWADFEITLQNGRYYFALRDSGTDPRIHVLDNMELFRLGGEDFHVGNILNVAPTNVSIASFAGDTNNDGLAPGSVSAGAAVANLCVVDENQQDRFTWEILGPGANFYTIDANGVLKAKVAITFSYLYWYAQVGAVTYSEWQAGDLTPGFDKLMGTQYGVTVRVTDAAGLSVDTDVFLYLENTHNTLVGTPQNDTLVGGAGQSFIAGLGGADTISDNDWLVLDYSASDAGVKVKIRTNGGSQISGGMVGEGGHAEGDIISLNRNARLDIIGSAFDDVLNGTSPGSWNWGHMLNGDNAIFGGGGNDIINAGGGSNWLNGGDGNDTITGGPGYDEIYGGDGYDIINAGGGTNYVDFGTGGGELKLPDSYQPYYANLETREFRYKTGQAGTTTTVVGDFGKLTGTNYDDEIHGSSGDDIIYGGGGTDDLYGGAGDDYLSGFGRLYGGGDNDIIILTGSGSGYGAAWGDAGQDNLQSSVQWSTILGGGDDDTLTSTTNYVKLIGGTGADTIIGSNPSKVNTVSYEYAAAGVGVTYNGGTGSGWAGEADGDVLQGNFSFIGSIWADQFNVTLNRQADVRGGAGNDIIYAVLQNYTTIYGDGMTLVPNSSDDDEIYTTGFGGTVYGGRGNDIISGVGELHGDAGADTITSAAGDHSIYLGVDADIDTFVFSRLQGHDKIYDFTSIDVIDIGAGYKYDDFLDIIGNSRQVTGGVEIWFDNNTTLLIGGYNMASLTAGNFDFT